MADNKLPEVLRSFVPGIWSKRYGAFSRGRAYYWIAMGVIAIGILFARAYFLPLHRGALDLKLLLHSPQEPFSPSRFPAISAALIGENADWTLCEQDPAGKGLVPDQLFLLFQKQALRKPQEALNAEDPQFNAIRRLTEPNTQWADHIDLKSPEELVYDESVTRAPGMNYPLRSERKGSDLRIPSQNNPRTQLAEKELPHHLSEAELHLSEAELPHLFSEAIRRSRAIEALRPFLGKPAILMEEAPKEKQGQDQRLPILKDFYFITTDGAIRALAPFRTNLVAHRSFLGSSFVQEGLFQTQPQSCMSNAYRNSRYHSRPYLDVNGEGLIVTLCYRMPSGQKNTMNEDITLGVFCIDIGLPQARVIESLQKSYLFKAVMAEVQAAPQTSPDAEHAPINSDIQNILICGQEGARCDSKRTLRASTAEELQRSEDAARQWWQQTVQRGTYAGAADIAITHDGAITVPISRESRTGGEERYVLAVLFFPARETGMPQLYIVAIACCLVLTSWLFTQAASEQDRRHESALIRGIPLGVLRLDEFQRIIGANDRAEELLNRPLPKFGLTDPFSQLQRKVAFRFTDLVCGGRVYFQRGDEAGFSVGNIEDILRERKRGLTGEYWGKLNTNIDGEREAWFRIIGAPILRPRGTLHTFVMFERIADLQIIDQLKKEESAQASAR